MTEPTAPTVAEPGSGAGPVAFARMTGSSIAARDAAPWVTDFLNAAYYRRAATERDVDDLRLAFSILTTYWYRRDPGRRLRVTDLAAFHRSFGADRWDTGVSPRGTLDRAQLMEGGCDLIGQWFAEAYADDARRGWGIAFPTVAERDAYDPKRRLALARLGALTPERAPAGEQTWHTYPPVRMPSAAAVVESADPSRDMAGLRHRDRPLHAAAPRRAGRADVRDRGGGRHGAGTAAVHPRLRDGHRRS